LKDLRVAPSARKHGVSDDVILHAFTNPIRIEELDDDMIMLIGPDHAGNLFRDRRRRQRRRPSRRARHGRATQVPQVTPMPRSIDEILEQADELAARFENHEPGHVKDAGALRAVRRAFQDRADAERQLADAVSGARADGHSWAAIGSMLGTSGEAARQRYGQPAAKS
jgi:DNA-directed RNA polymerase specialized sigma24 family protein